MQPAIDSQLASLSDVAHPWKSFASTDIDDVHEHMCAAFCPHDLSVDGPSGSIAFRNKRSTLGNISFTVTDYGTTKETISVSVPASEKLLLVQCVTQGLAEFTHQDKKVALRPGAMTIISPQFPFEQRTFPGCRHFTIKFERSQLEEILLEELGERHSSLVFKPDLIPLAGAGASFARFVNSVIDDLENDASSLRHPRILDSLEDTMARMLLACGQHNHTVEYLEQPLANVVPYYVKCAAQFIREHYKQPLMLAQLVHVAGVSERTLSTGFRRFLDTSPMGYLKNYRLQKAHQMLKDGASQGKNVTGIALACGFSHPSKFARDYLQRFGERPSETLRS